MTDTCNLQGLKGSTIYQITRSDTDPVFGAYILTAPLFRIINEVWKEDALHLYKCEIVYTHSNGNLCLLREFQKWNGFDVLHKPVILQIIDNPIESTQYNKVIIDMVDSIPDKTVGSLDPHSRYDILYEDAECRLYIHIQLVDDPSYDRGIRPVIDIYLEVVPYAVPPHVVIPKIPCPELAKGKV